MIYFAELTKILLFSTAHGTAPSPLFHRRSRGGERLSRRAKTPRFPTGIEPPDPRPGGRTRFLAIGTQRQVRASDRSRPHFSNRSSRGVAARRRRGENGSIHCHRRTRRTPRRLRAVAHRANPAFGIARLSG